LLNGSMVKLLKIIKQFNNSTIQQFDHKGFTLVEVLVAATIVALLSTVGVTSYQAITRQGRDALRKSDLEAIRSGLEIYKSENNSYPANSSECVADLSSGYLNPYPSDSKSPTYRYCYTRLTALTYVLCAHLENGGSSDNDCDNNPGNSNDCSSTHTTGSNCNYKVANP